jgi:hypothetical protein
MKRSGFGLLLVAVMAVAAVTANAQSIVLKVNVPFDFSVGGVMNPAGEYSITTPLPGLVQIGSWEHGRIMAPIKARTSSSEAKDALVFHNVNGHYFLASILTSSDSSSHTLFTSRQEREKLARGERAVTTVLMASAR